MNNIKILWADDEIDHLRAHLLFLEEKGYEVTTVTNGLDATDKVKENNYDLVFLDENMPGVSGLEALKIIKEIDGNIPVVMITKSEEDHIMEDAIGSKIADYLIKPVNPRQILSTIKKLIDNTRLETESVTQRYQQDFRHIGMAFMDYMNWPKWKETYKKLVYWETEMASSEETGMEEILKTQKQDGNREFSKYINRNYINFLSATADNEDAPMMSHNLMKRGILPHKKKGEPFFLLLLDNLRFDQWKVIQKEVSKYYRTTSEDMYMS
ncbi:response regulator, partial [Bacteroidia bacterium]|nr:response regulator [Bacteroidia bacterium]